MDVDQYLQRIHVNKVKDTSLEELAELQNQHMLHVPFENLDVIRHVPITLDVASFYRKVVDQHRGGFCYELNGLFHYLLKELGFSCHLVSATINRPDGSWAREGSHACIVVKLDQPYVTDVGFGDAARTPLPFSGEIREDISGSYRLKQVSAHLYDVERKQAGQSDWKTQNRIDTTPMKLKDFAAANHFNQTSPAAPFTQKDIVTLATSDGRVTLSGNCLVITRHKDKTETVVGDQEKQETLEKYFQIRI
jgi:N-hydroxyarylamine O-acetyltransferase